MLSIVKILDRLSRGFKKLGFGRWWVGRAFVDLLLLPSDLYKVVVPFRHAFGHFPSIFRPTTFNEWLQQSKLFRRKRIHTLYADKFGVREHIRKKIGDSILSRIYWSGTDLGDASFTLLPNRFVVKTNNGSGKNVIITDKSKVDWAGMRAAFNAWLASDHSVYFAEWQYRWIEPKIFIEEYLEGSDGGIPPDYKFFCFNGRVEIIQVDLDRFGKHTRAMLDRDFSILPMGYQYKTPVTLPKRPACLTNMIEIAEQLSIDEAFLRVDLYDIGRPVFGELTLHPEAGNGKFDPPEWDARLFKLLRSRNRLSV